MLKIVSDTMEEIIEEKEVISISKSKKDCEDDLSKTKESFQLIYEYAKKSGHKYFDMMDIAELSYRALEICDSNILCKNKMPKLCAINLKIIDIIKKSTLKFESILKICMKIREICKNY